MRFEGGSYSPLAALLDHLRQVFVRQTSTDDVAIRVRRERRAIEDGVDQATLLVILTPLLGHDVVVVKVAILWNVASHPVTRASQHEQVKYAVEDRGPTLGLRPKVE